MSKILTNLRRLSITEGSVFKAKELLGESVDVPSDLLEIPKEYLIFTTNKNDINVNELCSKNIRKGGIDDSELEYLQQKYEDVWVSDREEELRVEMLKNFGIYCTLKLLYNSSDDGEILNKNLSLIFWFMRPNAYDNRVKFHSLMSTILIQDNPENTINLIAEQISKGLDEKTARNADDVSLALDKLRKKDVTLDIEELENIITRTKRAGYSEYEESFTGDDFSLNRGLISLSDKSRKPTDDVTTQLTLDLPQKNTRDIEDSFSNYILELYDGIKSRPNKIDIIREEGNKIAKNIKTNWSYYKRRALINKSRTSGMVKSDLIANRNVKSRDGEIVIPNGALVEVKKMNYKVDSYLSEFFAIFKNSKIQADPRFKEDINPGITNLYKTLVNSVYEELKSEGNDIKSNKMLFDIFTSFNGIIFQDGIYIPNVDENGDTNIELYWSNKGQRDCTQPRLSIRFRVKSGKKIKAYHYSKNTGLMIPKIIKPFQVRPENKVNCGYSKPKDPSQTRIFFPDND